MFLQKEGSIPHIEAWRLNARHLTPLLKGPYSWNRTVSEVN
jgi:hypothetical protein